MPLDPNTATSPEQAVPNYEYRIAPGIIKRTIGRCALTLGLTASSVSAMNIGEALFAPSPVEATTFINSYPDSGAQPYNIATFDWWVDENGNGIADVTPEPSDNDETMSTRSYAYRNCTDGVAYWVMQYTGVSIPGWKNANNWDTAAINAGYTVLSGISDSIEPGDIAQSDDGSYGHVGFVTNVARNGSGTVTSITVAELNKSSDGMYTHLTYSSRNSSGKFSRGGSYDWDHFIDVNGEGVGLNGDNVPGSGNFDQGKDDIVAFEPNDGSHVSRYMQGKSQGDGQFQWGYSNLNNHQTPKSFEMGDINGDGKDDIVAFEPNNGSHVSRYITAASNGNGTFNYGYTNLVNMATPFEFHMGDINGDGKDDIVAFETTSSTSGRYMRGISQGNGQFAWDYTNLTGMAKPSHFALGDINGDGKDDVIAFELTSGSQIGRYMTGASTGNGNFNWGFTNLNNRQKPKQFEMGDINGDNKDDIIAFEPNDGSHVSRYITAASNGNGTFNYGYTNLVNMQSPKQFEVGDINGDGKDDIVAFEPNNGSQVSKYMQGTSQGNGQFNWGYSNLNNMQAPSDFDLGNFAE